MDDAYDAILVVGFGGPEGPEDVIPFLENVLRGRNVPRERMLEVAEHYNHFGGVSPINQQTRDLIDALRNELDAHDINLPIFWGNRNWHPLLPETLQEMAGAGIRRGLGLVLSGYSSYSSCRQYRENIQVAQAQVGQEAPRIDKLRVFYNHPEFIAATADRLSTALDQLPDDQRETAHIAFTAHSIPGSMAAQCRYEPQLLESCRLVAAALNIPETRWKLVYQSRSGRSSDPWLEPDICDHLRELHDGGVAAAVVMPIGFLSDHMEVLFDLDEEAAGVCQSLGMAMVRAHTVGTHPRFVKMLRLLIEERLSEDPERAAIGQFGPSHDVCPVDCCPAPVRPGRPVTG